MCDILCSPVSPTVALPGVLLGIVKLRKKKRTLHYVADAINTIVFDSF